MQAHPKIRKKVLSWQLHTLFKCGLAAIFGISLTLSFAPTYAWWFAPYCLAGFFALLHDCRPRLGMLLGLCFGLGWFSVGLWWIYTGLYAFSDAGPLLSAALLLCLLLYLSIFPACAAAVIALLQQGLVNGRGKPMLIASAGAGIWTCSEWLRGNLFGGFPWLTTGYTQTTGPLTGFAPVVGVYGLSFISAFAAALLAQCLLRCKPGKWQLRSIAMPLLCLLAIVGSGRLLSAVEWNRDSGRSMTVRLLQGNLPQMEKFSITGLKNSVATYVNFAANSTADLTVLPETAFPIEWNSMPDNVRTAFQMIADARATAIVVGTVIANRGLNESQYRETNSVIVVKPQTGIAAPAYRYDKEHLLPFGEYFPNGAKWIGPLLNINFSALAAGSENQKMLAIPKGKIGLSICYEDLFDTAIARKAGEAEILLNISNFAWFAHSFAPEQHLQAAQMRALETGRWFMQASNTGVTAIIDQHGVIQDALPQDMAATLDAEVRLRDGATPFMRTGNAPILLISALAILLAGWRHFRSRTRLPA